MKKPLVLFLTAVTAFITGSFIFFVPALADIFSENGKAAVPFWILQIILITILPMLCLRAEIRLCEKHGITQHGFNIAFFIGIGLSVALSGGFIFVTQLGKNLPMIWLTLLAGAVWALLSRIVFAAVVNFLNK